MAVALLRSWGCQAAVRREAAILPPRGLGKAQEGEERPSARWPQGRERQRRLRPADTRTRRCAPCSGAGGGATFTLALGGTARVGDGNLGAGGRLPAAAMGCSRRPARSRSSNKGAARPLLPPTSVPRAPWRAPAPRCGPGQDFPLRSFGKLAPWPVTLGGGAGKGGDPGGGVHASVQNCDTARFLSRLHGRVARAAVGSRAPPPVPGSRLRRARAGLKSPRGAPGQPASPRPSLQIRVACGLPEGSGLGPRGPPAAAGTLSRPPEGGNCITVGERPGGSSPGRSLGQVRG